MPLAQHRLLHIAIAVSVLAHVALLSLHFAAPKAVKLKPLAPELEIILVNARSNKAPLKATALAQANLDGGGNAEQGRATSPLPPTQQSADGSQLEVRRSQVAQREEKQSQMLAQLKNSSHPNADSAASGPRPVVAQDADALQLARLQAEIAQQIADYNKRPVKTQITPSTREVGYAMYYTAMQKRIEQIGTGNFPQQDGKKIYGELVLYIPVFHDGALYEKEGGPRVERSSGNPALDAAALRIVRRAAPFGSFPPALRSGAKDDVWEIITRFRFTREDMLATGLERGGN